MRHAACESGSEPLRRATRACLSSGEERAKTWGRWVVGWFVGGCERVGMVDGRVNGVVVIVVVVGGEGG